MPVQQLLTAANTLNLGDDLKLLSAIGATADKFDELKAEIPDLVDVEDLLDRLAADLQSAPIAAAFSKVGLSGALGDLQQFLGKILDQTKKIPAKYHALLSRIGRFKIGDADAVVSWSIATPAKPQIQTDRYTVDLGAQATIAFDAGAKWADDDPPMKLLKLSVGGKVRGAIGATIPYNFGSVQAGADASVQAELDVYASADDKAIYAVAVAESLGSLPDPFHFESVWTELSSGRLEAIHYAFDGAAHASLEVGFADTQALGSQIVAQLGATVKVAASLQSTYQLALRRLPTGRVRAQLSRKRVDEGQFGMELKLQVDLSSLTGPIVAAFQRAVGEWDKALDTIKPYLNPGTWLRNQALAQLKLELDKLIKDADLKAAVLADLKGALGLGPIKDADLVDWLAGKVTGAIDHASVLADGRINEAADRILGCLSSVVPGLVTADTAGKLKALLAAQVKKLDDGLRAEVNKVLAGAGKNLKQMLVDAGAKVTGAVTAFDDALKAVRDLLDHYDDALHDVLQKAEKIAKEKAVARLYAQETRTSGVMMEVVGDFTASDPKTEKVFEALTRGTLAGLVHVVDGADSAPGFLLDKTNSKITRFSKIESEQGLEVALLGFDLTFRELVKGEATIVVNGAGDISVTSDDEAQKILSLFNDRQVSFISSHSLALTAATTANPAAGRVRLETAISAVYADKSLSWKNVNDFLDGLIHAELLAPTATHTASSVFARWAGAGSSFNGRISAELHLSGEQAQALILLPSRPTGPLDMAAKQWIVQVALDALRFVPALDKVRFQEGFDLARKEFKLLPPPVSDPEVVLTYRQAIFPIHLPSEQGMPRHLPQVIFDDADSDEVFLDWLDQAYALERLVELVEKMRSIYLQTPAAGTAGGWTVKDYRNAQATMATDSLMWMTVAAVVADLFDSRITPRTLAFMRALADMAGAPRHGGAMITMTHQPKSGDPETVSFA